MSAHEALTNAGWYPDEATRILRELREAGHAVVKVSEQEHALYQVWDDGNGVGLDGWIGPDRGSDEVDDEAVLARRRAVGWALDELRAAANKAEAVSDGN